MAVRRHGARARRQIGPSHGWLGLPDGRIVTLTTCESDERVFEARRAGATGFLVKDTKPAELLRAVCVVATGDALLWAGVTRRLIEEFAAQVPARRQLPALDALTDREREVMALVAGYRPRRSPNG